MQSGRVRSCQRTRCRGCRDRWCVTWTAPPGRTQPRTRAPAPTTAGTQGSSEQDQQDPDDEEQHHERQVDARPAQPQRGDDLAQCSQGRLGQRVDRLGHEQRRTAGAPLPREDPDPVEDDSADEHEEVEEDDEPQDLTDGTHGRKSDRRARVTLIRVVQLWLKTVRPGTTGPSSALTSTVSGESRKTLLVTRSIDPRRPKTRPAAKSTSRLASASLMSVRFMMTGMLSRKFSPIVLASL